MEKKVIFRANQEQLYLDHVNLQDYARASLDHLVSDAVTASRRFAGFACQKSAQAQVTVEPGRFYDQSGAVFVRGTQLVQSMVPYLAAAARRIVTLSAYGVENEVDVETRDFAVIANPDQPLEIGQQIPTEPDAVAMTLSRDAVLVFTQGAESADPLPPALPATHVAIAHILVDPTQVVSITMVAANEVASTEELDLRAKLLEEFQAQIGPRVASLASDLASLQNRVNQLGPNRSLQAISEDIAKLKESLRYPATASDYGADSYFLPHQTDLDDDLSLGNDSMVQEGLRFPFANANEAEISLFSANDPNASLTGGVLLPKFSDELKITTWKGSFESDLGIAQYGFQTVEMKQGYMSRSRLRYGGGWYEGNFGTNWGATIYSWEGGTQSPRRDQMAANLYDYESWEQVFVTDAWWDETDPDYQGIRYDRYYFDTWKEPFLYAVTVDHTITGAQIAESFLATNDIWATRIGIYVSQKAANEDIHLAICETIAGQPNPERVMAKVVHPHASITAGWNRIVIPPTFLRKGRKYAVILVSNANHRVGMVSGQSYLDGTFFTNTDGLYFLGDLTKDLALEIWGAKFAAPQVTIEFAPINLDGGVRNIDILAEMWVPDSTQLVWEIRPNGTGEWLPLLPDTADVLANAPPLLQFRARFDGTRDMQPALTLTGSRVRVSRPKTAFKHVSTPIELQTPSDEIHVKVRLEHFDDTPHDHSLIVRTGASFGTSETADTVNTKLIDGAKKIYEREYVFNLGAAIDEFVIEQNGSTNSAQNTYQVAERTYYAA